MAQVNVNRKVTDPFYRYKMPRLVAKVEGRGNGIKTVIVNMVDIAKSLRRPPLYTTKFLGIELGAQVSVDNKNERYIVNGSHESEKLQDLLYEFIEKYILCPECDNPETEIIVLSKKERIKVKCKACGNQSMLSHAHRLNMHIMKNPPPSSPSLVNNPPPPSSSSVVHSESVSSTNGIGKFDGSGTLKEEEPKQLATSASNKSSNAEDDKWFADTSTTAVQQRMQSLSVRAAAFASNVDLEKPLHDRLNMFFELSQKCLNDTSSPECYQEIELQAKRLDVEDSGVFVLGDILFDGGAVLSKIEAHKDLFQKFALSGPKAQRNLIGAVEVAASKFPDKVLPKLAQIFQLLYQHELVEEEVFLKWSERKSSRFAQGQALLEKIHKGASPFINWLMTAEEESDDSGGDSDTGVVFTHNGVAPASVGAVPTGKEDRDRATLRQQGKLEEEEENDEEEEVDIDEI